MTFSCYNTRLYKAEGRITPEIKAVADYALENIGDCTGDQKHIYLTLRVGSLYFYSVSVWNPSHSCGDIYSYGIKSFCKGYWKHG